MKNSYTEEKRKKRLRGQSLLEALLFIGLGVILVGGSASLMGVSLRSFNSANQKLQVNSLMRQSAEIIRSSSRDNWHNIYDLVPGIHYKSVKQNNNYVIQRGEEKVFDTQGLVSYWNFDEATSTIAYDSQSVNNGNLTNGPIWQSASNCVSGSCLSFDGGDDYVDVGNVGSLNMTQGITIAMYFRPNATLANWQGVLGKGGGSAFEYGYEFGTVNNNFGFWINNQSNFAGTTKPSVGTLNYWVGTYDKQNIKLYKDGVLVATVPYSADMIPTASNFLIGKVSILGGNATYTNGVFDDVRIYNRALSASEIQTYYKAGLDKLGLVSYWAMDENGGTTAYDNQSTNNGTLYNSLTWQSENNCVSGSCLSFNGSNNYISHPTTGINSRKGTVEGWVKPNTTSNWGFWQTHDSSGYNWVDWISIFTYTDGTFYFRMGDGTNCCSNDVTFWTASYIPSGQWSHLSFTWEGTTMKAYVNGALIASRTNAVFQDIVDPGARIGQGHDRMMNGFMDEVRVYNRALSAEEIAQNYQAGYTRFFVTNKISRNTPTANIDATYNSANNDPSTLKINSIIKYGRGLASQQANTIDNLRFYLTRSYNNQTFWQTDWSGGGGQTGPISNTSNKFDTADANINYATTTGSIFMATPSSTPATLISSILDTGVNGGAGFNSLLWQGSLGSGGTTKFQIAFSNLPSGPWTYYGPSSTSDWYQPNPGFSVAIPLTGSASPQNMRYIRYKAQLLTSSTSPRIDDVIINWTP